MRPQHSTLSLLFAVGVCVACGERPQPEAVETAIEEGRLDAATTAGGSSRVRMINAVPTGSATTVMADDSTLFRTIDYRTVTPYTALNGGFTNFRVQSGARDTTIASNNEITPDGSRYTLLTLPQDDGGVRLRVLRDEFDGDTTRARLRVVHGVTGAGDIDVLIEGRTEPLFDNVNLTSEAGFETLDAQPVMLIVRADGSGKRLLRKELRMEAGHSYTVVLTGSSAQRIEAIIVDDRAVPTEGSGASRTDTAPGGMR